MKTPSWALPWNEGHAPPKLWLMGRKRQVTFQLREDTPACVQMRAPPVGTSRCPLKMPKPCQGLRAAFSPRSACSGHTGTVSVPHLVPATNAPQVN